MRNQILQLHKDGKTNAEIAMIVGCARSTVTYHLVDRYHRRAYFVDRYRSIKQKAVDYKGGCCCRCGYKKFLGALEFHHVNPAEKDAEFKCLTKQSRSFENIKKELDKCVLVCANCHREIHEELRVGGSSQTSTD